MSDPLVEFLRTCCVHVLGRSPGCGFFIAPKLVVTCSHVVGRERKDGEEIRLEKWDQGGGFSPHATATILRNFPVEDIAFIQTSYPNHTYAPLSGEGARLGHQLTALGFPKEGEHYVFDQFSVNYEGQTLKTQATTLVKFKAGQVEGGYSGGPLLNLHTCRVMGVVRLTRDHRTAQGGWAVEISVLERLLLECGQELPQIDPSWTKAAEKQRVEDQPNKVCFHTYLQSVIEAKEYHDLHDVYTPTTVEDRIRVRQSGLKLRVMRLKQPDKPEEKNDEDQVEQFEVLAGLRQYAADHVLLIGKPGSGKSTALTWLLWQEANSAIHDPGVRIPV